MILQFVKAMYENTQHLPYLEKIKNNHFNLLLKYDTLRAVRVTYSSLRHCNLTSKNETYLPLGVLILCLSVFIDLNSACFLLSECSSFFFLT